MGCCWDVRKDLKELSSPKNEYSVIIYSLLCCAKPVWLTFSCEAQKGDVWQNVNQKNEPKKVIQMKFSKTVWKLSVNNRPNFCPPNLLFLRIFNLAYHDT